jgi:hypothetical protein
MPSAQRRRPPTRYTAWSPCGERTPVQAALHVGEQIYRFSAVPVDAVADDSGRRALDVRPFASGLGDGGRGDHQNGAVGVLEDGMGDASQQQRLQAATAAGAEDDGVGWLPLPATPASSPSGGRPGWPASDARGVRLPPLVVSGARTTTQDCSRSRRDAFGVARRDRPRCDPQPVGAAATKRTFLSRCRSTRSRSSRSRERAGSSSSTRSGHVSACGGTRTNRDPTNPKARTWP